MSEINNSQLIRKVVLFQAAYVTLFLLGSLTIITSASGVLIPICFQNPTIIPMVLFIIAASICFLYCYCHTMDEPHINRCQDNRLLGQFFGHFLIFDSQMAIIGILSFDSLAVKVQFGLLMGASVMMMASYLLANRFKVYNAEFKKVYAFSLAIGA